VFDALIAFSLRHRALVVAGAAALLVYGALAIRSLPVDVLPDLNRPTVTVMAEAGGLSPPEVEARVTWPLERALQGVPGVERIRSSSAVGLSILWLELGWDQDLLLARQQVSERLQSAREQLPPEVHASMGPISSIMGEVVLVGVSSRSGEVGPMALRTLADWTVRPRLLVPGVSQVIAIGGEVRQLQVLVDPRKLRAFGLGLEEVERAAGLSQQNTAGGFLEQGGQEHVVRNVARSASAEALASTVVAVRDGLPITLRQVAEVREGPRVRRGDAGVDGSPAVILSVQKQPGTSTVELTRRLEQALRELRGTVPADVELRVLFRQASFIEAAIGNVEEALRDGALLVVLVLFAFLLNLRTTAVTLTAIPLSFVITALVMRAFGMSVNTMTLGGLAVAIGELVDDAIVDVENVHRRLRENAALPEDRRLPVLAVVHRASSEVRGSIVYATALVVLVFAPLFSLSGVEGRLFAPLGAAYVLSILASLLVSLTVTPALCSYLLGRTGRSGRSGRPGRPGAVRGDAPLVRWLKRWDERLLRLALPRPWLVLGVAGVLVAAAALCVPLFGREFLPPFNEGTVTVTVVAPPGTSLSQSSELGTLAERLLKQVPEVVSTGRRTGRAEADEHAEGVHFTEIDLDLRPGGREREEVLHALRDALAALPGVVVGVGQPISHRIDHLLSGVRAQVAVKIFGPDLAVLRGLARQVAAVAGEVPGMVDVQAEAQVPVPRLDIQVRPDQARRFGVPPGQLAQRLQTALEGKVVGQVVDGPRTVEVLVRYDERARSSPEAIAAAWVDVDRTQVPVRQVAALVETSSPNLIQREDGERRIAVSGNVEGRSLSETVDELRARVAEAVQLPPGYRVVYGGQFESQERGLRRLWLLGLLSVALMVVVLYSHFRSGAVVAQVMLNVPLALVGSVAAVLLTGGVLSLATVIGFITLCGIASRNTIMMISHYLHLAREEGMAFGEELVVRGSLERLVPVLMTALTAGLALVPLVLSRGAPGKELLFPVAAVILGGLVSSTVLDMVVTPVAFLRFGRRAVERAMRKESGDEVQ
jgi:CzcA family heavy metal efflux pump